MFGQAGRVRPRRPRPGLSALSDARRRPADGDDRARLGTARRLVAGRRLGHGRGAARRPRARLAGPGRRARAHRGGDGARPRAGRGDPHARGVRAARAELRRGQRLPRARAPARQPRVPAHPVPLGAPGRISRDRGAELRQRPAPPAARGLAGPAPARASGPLHPADPAPDAHARRGSSPVAVRTPGVRGAAADARHAIGDLVRLGRFRRLLEPLSRRARTGSSHTRAGSAGRCCALPRRSTTGRAWARSCSASGLGRPRAPCRARGDRRGRVLEHARAAARVPALAGAGRRGGTGRGVGGRQRLSRRLGAGRARAPRRGRRCSSLGRTSASGARSTSSPAQHRDRVDGLRERRCRAPAEARSSDCWPAPERMPAPVRVAPRLAAAATAAPSTRCIRCRRSRSRSPFNLGPPAARPAVGGAAVPGGVLGAPSAPGRAVGDRRVSAAAARGVRRRRRLRRAAVGLRRGSRPRLAARRRRLAHALRAGRARPPRVGRGDRDRLRRERRRRASCARPTR